MNVEDFIKSQVLASERLFKAMNDDHKERIKQMTMWAEMNYGLMKKLDERDAEIERLKSEINTLKTAERI